MALSWVWSARAVTVVAMVPVLLLSAAALVWSGVSNLLLGDEGYLVRNLAVTALLLVGAWRAGWQARELGLARDRLLRGLGFGLVATGVVVAVVLIGVLLAERVPLIAGLLADQRAADASERLLFETTLRIPLGTALFEEVLFRGVLFAAWARVGGTSAAVLGSSLVFGLWHVPPTMVALELNGVAVATAAGVLGVVGGVVVTAVGGVLFAWLRWASGSLLAPVLAHTATNVAGLLAAVAVSAG